MRPALRQARIASSPERFGKAEVHDRDVDREFESRVLPFHAVGRLVDREARGAELLRQRLAQHRLVLQHEEAHRSVLAAGCRVDAHFENAPVVAEQPDPVLDPVAMAFFLGTHGARLVAPLGPRHRLVERNRGLGMGPLRGGRGPVRGMGLAGTQDTAAQEARPSAPRTSHAIQGHGVILEEADCRTRRPGRSASAAVAWTLSKCASCIARCQSTAAEMNAS